MSRVTTVPPTSHLQNTTSASQSTGTQASEGFPSPPMAKEGATREQVRAGLRASVAQPGLASTPEEIEQGVRHARMEAAVVAFVKPLPKPGTLEFNEAQKRHWVSHGQPTDSKEVQRARMMARIAQDQADAGIQFEGQRDPQVERTALADAERTQTSQALRAQGPIGMARQVVADSIAWVSSFIGGKVDTHAMSAADFARWMESTYIVERSPAFEALESSGAPMRNTVIAYFELAHYSRAVETDLREIVYRYMDAGKGDRALSEGIAFRDGRQLTTQEARFSCYGFPQEKCSFLTEPGSVQKVLELRESFNGAVVELWDYLLKVLPPETAKAMAALHAKTEAAIDPALRHPSNRFSVIQKYYAHIPAQVKSGSEWVRLAGASNAAVKAREDAQNAVLVERTRMYWEEVLTVRDALSGGNLLTWMGFAHSPRHRGLSVSGQLLRVGNQQSDYKGNEIPVLYIYGRKGRDDL